MKAFKATGLAVFLFAFATVIQASEVGGFERTLQVAPPIDVEVTTGSGNITVHTGPGNTVHIVAKIRARDSWFGMSASEKVKRIQDHPPIEQTGSTIRIGRIDDHELQQNVSIDYDLTVPAQSKVMSQTGSGNESITGVQLPLTARTGSGNITVDDAGSDARVHSGSGNLRITTVKGFLSAETGSGNIVGHNIGGEVSANSGSGEVEVEQIGSGKVRVSVGSGSVRLRGVKGGLYVETGSGDIHVQGEPTADWRVGSGSGRLDLQIPANASFNIDARTSSGRLNTNHQITVQGSVSRNHLQGKAGNGGVLLDLHTGSGDIDVN